MSNTAVQHFSATKKTLHLLHTHSNRLGGVGGEDDDDEPDGTEDAPYIVPIPPPDGGGGWEPQPTRPLYGIQHKKKLSYVKLARNYCLLDFFRGWLGLSLPSAPADPPSPRVSHAPRSKLLQTQVIWGNKNSFLKSFNQMFFFKKRVRAYRLRNI